LSSSSSSSLSSSSSSSTSVSYDSSDSSITSQSRSSNEPMDIARDFLRRSVIYTSIIFKSIDNENIRWHENVPVISDICESDALEDFRFRKEHLQEFSDILFQKLFPNAQSKIISVENRYKVHFETGLLIMLYRLSNYRKLRPDMEKYFRLRKSHISAISTHVITEIRYRIILSCIQCVQ
jgi:hypothetical protein